MKSIYYLLIALLAINSCKSPENNLISDLGVGNDRPVLISGINSMDCIMCFGNINRKYENIVSSCQIPKENRFFYVKNTRKIAQSEFLKNYLNIDSSSSIKLIQDEELIKKIDDRLTKNAQSQSYYVVLSPSGQILKQEEYKPK